MDRRRISQSLQRAMEANAAAYRHAVQTGAPGQCWDVLVLTATNEKQAQGYRQELAVRQRAVGPTHAFFPAMQRAIVVPDPPGPRIGSGGATLNVLRALAKELRVAPDELGQFRILLIHSGGMSQRLPAYSPLGKIFAPLPLLRPDAQIATLFDHLYLTLAGLPPRLGPGMLILAGDVFLLFDHRQVQKPSPGVTALTMRVDADLGTAHGVFVTNRAGVVTRTLQKATVEQMRASGALDAAGRVLIDTGLLFFDPERLRVLSALAGGPRKAALHVRHKTQLDLYDDVARCMTNAASSFDASPMYKELTTHLHGVRFQVMQLAGEFLHLGTTRQFRDAMTGNDPSPAAQLFQQNLQFHSEWSACRDARVYNSILRAAPGGETGQLGAGTIVEHSTLTGRTRIGKGCFISQVQASEAFALRDNRLLFQVPVPDKKDGICYVRVLCGVEDDFKGCFCHDQCRFLNAPIQRWMTARAVSPEDLWAGIPHERRSLWNARLYRASSNAGSPALDIAILESGRYRSAEGDFTMGDWRKSPRYSMAMLLEAADTAAMTADREAMSARLQATAFLEALREGKDQPVDVLISRYATPAAYRASAQILTDFAQPVPRDASQPLLQARALWCCGQLCLRPDHPQAGAAAQAAPFMEGAFGKIAQASELGHRSIRVGLSPAKPLTPGLQVIAASPVRLDLSGGWSDTPPYCFERGGHVVNVAINLDGQPPVRATVTTIPRPRLILESRDLGRQIDLTRDDSRLPIRVDDPFALHKVALQMVGFLPTCRKDRADQMPSRHLASLGAGLHITTECRVPKGSGLGTSSILGATLLAALHRVRGALPSTSELVEQTNLLEQRLSTGGGWQDQVGGIVPGVKSTVSLPGIPQRLKIESLALSDQQYRAIEQRLVVYYSGQQRLARDILRRVMGRWLGREPALLLLMEQLKASAQALRNALLRSQWKTAAREIARYWQIKKELYPGSTTPAVDELLLELRGHYLAAGFAGAGGGGFAYFFCESPHQADKLRDLLARRSSRPGSLGTVYETQINRVGLLVTRPRRGDNHH